MSSKKDYDKEAVKRGRAASKFSGSKVKVPKYVDRKVGAAEIDREAKIKARLPNLRSSLKGKGK